MLQEINDMLKEKYIVDAENVELTDKASGKHMTDKYMREMQDEEERK